MTPQEHLELKARVDKADVIIREIAAIGAQIKRIEDGNSASVHTSDFTSIYATPFECPQDRKLIAGALKIKRNRLTDELRSI